MPRLPYRFLLATALASILVLSLPPAPAFPANPGAGVSASKAALDAAVRKHAAATARLAATQRRAEAASERLDRLYAAQEKAQSRLNAQVAASYRTGQGSFLALLTGAMTFESFADRWYLLTRINSRFAADLIALREARQRSARSARSLMALQSEASAQVRALDISVADARARLSSSQAALAEYQRRIAAQKAAAERRAAEKAAAARLAAKTAARTAKSKTSAPVSSASGGWLAARCSNYGPGSYGHRTADGTRIGPNSMIVAHKTLPFGTLVEFSYGGKNAIGVVADRGPYVAGRQFDLGPGVAHTLGLNGVYTVRYRVIGR